eukprot:gene6047-1083_t
MALNLSMEETVVLQCQRQGYAIVDLTAPEAAIVSKAMGCCGGFFMASPDEDKAAVRVSAKLGYKRHPQKERYQWRRAGSADDPRLSKACPGHPDGFRDAIVAAYDLFDAIAVRCLSALCTAAGVD